MAVKVREIEQVETQRIRDLIERYGGSFSSSLGINLSASDPVQIYRWFLASLLFGARISQTIAINTYMEFMKRGYNNPYAILDAGLRRLIRAEGAGGYARYDYRTATKIISATESLIEKYGGDLNLLEKSASGYADLETKLMEFKGVGPVTVNIFLREMRGIWQKADPPLGALAIAAAKELNLVPRELIDEKEILKALQFLWKESGIIRRRFADLEAALVRYAIKNRHKLKESLHYVFR